MFKLFRQSSRPYSSCATRDARGWEARERFSVRISEPDGQRWRRPQRAFPKAGCDRRRPVAEHDVGSSAPGEAGESARAAANGMDSNVGGLGNPPGRELVSTGGLREAGVARRRFFPETTQGQPSVGVLWGPRRPGGGPPAAEGRALETKLRETTGGGSATAKRELPAGGVGRAGGAGKAGEDY